MHFVVDKLFTFEFKLFTLALRLHYILVQLSLALITFLHNFALLLDTKACTPLILLGTPTKKTNQQNKQENNEDDNVVFRRDLERNTSEDTDDALSIYENIRDYEENVWKTKDFSEV